MRKREDGFAACGYRLPDSIKVLLTINIRAFIPPYFSICCVPTTALRVAVIRKKVCDERAKVLCKTKGFDGWLHPPVVKRLHSLAERYYYAGHSGILLMVSEILIVMIAHYIIFGNFDFAELFYLHFSHLVDIIDIRSFN